MKIRKLVLATAIAGLAFGSAPLFAAGGVQVFVEKDGVAFDAAIDAPGVQLRITGPGAFLREATYLDGEQLRLPMEKNGAWPDGQYRFELVPIHGMADRSRGETAPPLPKGAFTGTLNGSFQVVEGKLVPVDESLVEPQSKSAGVTLGAKDQVFNDDVIITQSLCVGFDCVNGENFGFDTIRLKENNTRIKFEDTSTGSFPSNDWQLTANDSASGGQNRFSIEDVTGARNPFTIEGGATTNSIYVDSTGRVGFRTSTPVLDLHVATSNTPGIRLEQTNAGGFNAQTWDIAGNEANFFVRDVTSGSRLPFRIRPGAPTSSIDIAANGNVGIGTASPNEPLHLVRAGPARFTLTNSTITNSATQDQDWIINSNGTLRLSAGTDSAEFTLDASGNLTVTGGFFVNATQLNVPDFVFEPSYNLSPIEDQARYMMENKHLPAVGQAPAKDAQLNVVQQQIGMLEELEKAHLYIVQLNERLNELEAERDQARSAVTTLEARLDKLEAQ